jgi:hypothetical protein
LALQQAYAQSLAERAEDMAKAATDLKAADESQNASSVPAKFGCGKKLNGMDLVSAYHFRSTQDGVQDLRNSQWVDQENTFCMRHDGFGVDDVYQTKDGMDSELTTVMLCNIPCRVSLEEIEQAVAFLGFEGTYDLLHAPGPKRRHRNISSTTNIGYAFINFQHPEHAQRFINVFDGFHFVGRQSDKLGVAKFARIQGFQNNYMLLKGGSLAQCVLPLGLPWDHQDAMKPWRR